MIATRMVSKRQLKLHVFYRVIWDDIVSFSGWEAAPKEKPAECVSHGWVTRIDKLAVTLSATRGVAEAGSEVEYNQHVAIPLKVIKSVEEI